MIWALGLLLQANFEGPSLNSRAVAHATALHPGGCSSQTPALPRIKNSVTDEGAPKLTLNLRLKI
jgi:hypothetical protein